MRGSSNLRLRRSPKPEMLERDALLRVAAFLQNAVAASGSGGPT